MDTLNDLNERVDAFVGTSSFDTPAAANDQAPIDVPAEVHEDIVASVDFSEVELADEFTEPQVAVTPNGLLPMEPLPIDGRLRKAALRMPDEIEEASGFTLFGRRIKSLIYTTDVAVIRNSNADAGTCKCFGNIGSTIDIASYVTTDKRSYLCDYRSNNQC